MDQSCKQAKANDFGQLMKIEDLNAQKVGLNTFENAITLFLCESAPVEERVLKDWLKTIWPEMRKA